MRSGCRLLALKSEYQPLVVVGFLKRRRLDVQELYDIMVLLEELVQVLPITNLSRNREVGVWIQCQETTAVINSRSNVGLIAT